VSLRVTKKVARLVEAKMKGLKAIVLIATIAAAAAALSACERVYRDEIMKAAAGAAAKPPR
jgi:hypothetical protein